MKLTTKQLRRIVKEEIAAQKKQQLNEMVDPVWITALQQAFTLDPKAFRLVLGAILMIPTIPGEWKKQAKKMAQQEEPEERDVMDLVNALHDFSKNTGGEGFSDTEKSYFNSEFGSKQ